MSLADVFKGLKDLQGAAEQETARAVRATAQAIREDAIKAVRAHQSKGVTYKRGNVLHTASQAGNPPNQDRGTLTRNIRVKMNDDITANVGSYAPYSEALEFGTTKMGARPFMTPAGEGQREKHKKRLEKAIANSIKAATK